jgi:hypothetical protein
MPITLLSLFSQVSDPRRGEGKMYPLAPILLFAVLRCWSERFVSSGPRLHPHPP